MLLADTRIIARQSSAAGGLEVLAQRHEVMWRDGTTVHLHPVHRHGLPMLTLRALAMPGGYLVLVDLAHLVRALDGDLRATPERDVPGHVFFTLRQAYASATLFVADAQRRALGTWWPVADGHVWQAAARAIDREVLATMDLAAMHAATMPQLGTAHGAAWGQA
jgi:hypothetical protein